MSDILNRIKENLAVNLGLEGEELEEFINMARQSLQNDLLTLETAFPDDITTVGVQAHTIKGALLNLGLESEADKARAIELQAKEGKIDGLEDMIVNLKECLQDLLTT